MAKNLINDESFEFAEGADKVEIESLAERVTNAEEKAQTAINEATDVGDGLQYVNRQIEGIVGVLDSIEESIDAVGQSITELSSRETALEERVTSLENRTDESVLLFSGSAKVGDNITLSEAFTNFKQIMFVANGNGSCLVVVGEEAKPDDVAYAGTSLFVNGRCGIAMTRTEKFVNTVNDLYIEFNRAILSVTNETTLNIVYGSRVLIGSGIQTETFLNIKRIYGIGRVASAE